MFRSLYFPLLFILLFFILFTEAQSQNERMLTYNSRNNGLVNNLTKAVAQDSLGFVWVATDEGLSRFNGMVFQNFLAGLPSNYVKSFLKTKNGALLAATDMGIVKIISKPDTAYFINIIKGSDQITDSTVHYPKLMMEDSKQNIWITDNKGIVCYRNKTLKRYAFDRTFKNINYQRTFSIVEMPSGNIFAFSPDGYAYFLDNKIDNFIEIKGLTQFQGVNFAIAINANTILLATSLGIYELKTDANNTILSHRNIFPDIDASYIVQKNEYEFAISTWASYVVVISNRDNKYEIKKTSYLSAQRANWIYIDRFKNAFVSTDEGIVLIQPTQFLAETNKNYQSYINSLSLFSDREIWATNYGSILKISYSNNQIITTPIARPALIGDISAAVPSKIKANSYWISTNAAMLYFVVNNKIEKTIDISAIGKNMFTCMEDDEENLWGCVDGFDGVVKISRDFVLKPYGKDKGLNNKLIVVKQRSDGTIFGGGGTDNNYLYQYNKTEDKFYNLSRKLNFITNNDIYINDIAFYSNIIWLATTHGVLKYDSVKTERLNLGDYTERNTFSIAAENSGALWFSNGKGVMKYANNQAVLFDDNNGLSNLTATYRCLAIDSLNRIWLGTSLGVNFSENLAQTQSTPLPIITNIYVNNSKIKDLTGQIKYTKGSFLTLNFFSLSFPGNEISYQYKLSAENSNWIDIQSKTELILPNLPVGKHSFEIRAKQQGNYQWSEGTRLEILIIRPWFMRWWAYVLYFIVLNLVIYVIVKINSNRLEAQKLHLEQLVKERTNEVVAQKNEILGKNEVLQQNMEELRTLNENVEEQKNIIAKTNLRLQLQATELSEKNTTLEQFNYQLKKYYTVLEQSPAAVLITDINGTIEYVNPFFTKLTGYTTDEVIGKNPRILKSKETPNEVFTDLWSTILSGKIWEGTITNRKKDKSLIVEKVIIAPIFDNNTIVNFVAIKNDVTELIRAEKLILESLETTQKQKVIIEKAHKNIVNSINYGKTIQDALLTSKKLIDQYLSEYFLLFKPKETVSGDFYYINKISDTLIFAVADCTGHGVSGGFMTMLGITYIHEIVRQTEISDANRVLSVLRDRFKNTFKTFGTENRNGMDINFCTVNLKTNVLQYAGAYNPLFIIRNGELTEYEATRAPIGFYPVEIEFKNNEIQLYDNDLIYLFSDGYQDQLGGDNSRKFTKKQFKQKLIDVSSEPLSIQFQIIEDDLKNWQKERAQTDDITVLGLKWKTQSIHEIKA